LNQHERRQVLIKHPLKRHINWLILIVLSVLLIAGQIGYFDSYFAWFQSDALNIELAQKNIDLVAWSKKLLMIGMAFWIGLIASDIIQNRIQKMQDWRSPTRTLIAKIFQILVFFIVFLVGLDILGLDLKALTLLGGTIGIGIGFGLQKIASNFISGIILLVEKSVEEGDILELIDGTMGTLKKTGARFSLIETFDGREVFVPNEDFITQRIVNWTYSSNIKRIELPINVAYKTDLSLAQSLILEAAKNHPDCSSVKDPLCFLQDFADSSVNFILYFWVTDVTSGTLKVRSELLMSIWQAFKEHEIEIPFPQRELHVAHRQLKEIAESAGFRSSN
jgi:small-conductance mechanosensitive channel